MFGSLVLFLIITMLSLQNKLNYLDQLVINLLIDNSPSFVVATMDTITVAGSVESIVIMTFLAALLLLYKRRFGYIVFLFSLTFGGIILNFLLKILFQRERPGETSVIEIFGYSLEMSSYSFPSGHTMRSVLFFFFIMYIGYYFIKKNPVKIGVIVAMSLLIVAISLSRIIVGAHFPSDILAAVAVSISWFYFCLLTLEHLQFLPSSLTLDSGTIVKK